MKTLAIGIDAADERLVSQLIADGQLPVLARLEAEGRRTAIASPARTGNVSVWPTFFTGTPPPVHGIYSGWPWSPERMGVVPLANDHLHPFWEPLAREDVSVGILDIPVAPHVGLERGFEVTEWFAHYGLRPHTGVSPSRLASLIDRPHPCASPRCAPSNPDGPSDLRRLHAACVDGAAMRGDLAERLITQGRPDIAVVTFIEVHRASHDMWHTVEPDHPLYADLPDARRLGRGLDLRLADVYRAVDTQIGRLAEAAGSDAAVVVFALHGMRAGRGLANVLLQPVLEGLGYSRAPRHAGRTGGFGRAALATVKGRTPIALKRVYHRHMRSDRQMRLAAPTMMPVLDWAATRAFAVPGDQHGFVRVNLRGREAEGSVAPEEYADTVAELRADLECLCTLDGRPVVDEVIPGDPSGAPNHLLPDLVVHWADTTFEQPVRLRTPAVTGYANVPDRTGQHRSQGFCIARGLELPQSVHAHELAALLINA